MLNIFPIQFLAPLAYTLLRVILGLILVRFGIQQIKRRRVSSANTKALLSVGIFEIIAGVFLFIGMYTQIAALLSMFLATLYIFRPFLIFREAVPPRTFFILIFSVSLSLFITGAGAFAFDLPI